MNEPTDMIADDLSAVSSIGRRLGVVEMQLAVNHWLLKHQRELSPEAMRELMQAVRMVA